LTPEEIIKLDLEEATKGQKPKKGSAKKR